MTQPLSTGDPVVVEPLQPTVKGKRGTSWLNVLLGVAVLAAIGGVAFAAGRLTAPAAAVARNGAGGGNFPGGGNFGPRASGAPGGNFQGGGFFGAGGVTLEGTVASRTADTLTITTSNGQTVEIQLPADTTYHTQAAGSSDSVQSGATVRVQVDVQRGQGQGQAGRFSASDVTVVP